MGSNTNIDLNVAGFDPKGWSAGRLLPEKEVPSVANMPQLAFVLNETKMSTWLQDNLHSKFTNGERSIVECHLSFVRYKLPRYCHAYFRAKVRSNESDAVYGCVIGAKIFGADFADRDIARILKRIRRVQPTASKPVFYPELRMIVVSFPGELKIHGMPDLLSAGRLEAALQRASSKGRPKVEFSADRPPYTCWTSKVARGKRYT